MRKLKTPQNELWKINRPSYDKWLQEVLLHNIGDFVDAMFDLGDNTQGVLTESQNALALSPVGSVVYDSVAYIATAAISSGTGFYRDSNGINLLRWKNQSNISFNVPTGGAGATILMHAYLTFSYQDNVDEAYSVPVVPLVAGSNVVVRQDMVTAIDVVLSTGTAPTGIYLGELEFLCDGGGLPTTYIGFDNALVNYAIFRPTKDRFQSFDSRIAALDNKIGNLSVINNHTVVYELAQLESEMTDNAAQLQAIAQMLFGADALTNSLVSGYRTLVAMNTELNYVNAQASLINSRFAQFDTIVGPTYDLTKGTIQLRLQALESYPDGVFHVAQDIDLRSIKMTTTDHTTHHECTGGYSPSLAVGASDVLDAPSIDAYVNQHAGFRFNNGAADRRLDYSLVDPVGVLELHLDVHDVGGNVWTYGEHDDDRIILKKTLQYTLVDSSIVTYSGNLIGYSFRGYVNGANAFLTLEHSSGATKTLINLGGTALTEGYHSATPVSLAAAPVAFANDFVIRAAKWDGAAWINKSANIQGNLVLYYVFTSGVVS